MRNIQFVLVMMVFFLTACSDNFHKNKQTIEMIIIEKEADKGNTHVKIKIKNHSETKNNIRVVVEITGSLKATRTDTINFVTTGDGFVVE